jgi:hypothetical protein
MSAPQTALIGDAVCAGLHDLTDAGGAMPPMPNRGFVVARRTWASSPADARVPLTRC